MDKRNSRFGRKPEPIDAHLSDELLLLAVDGELAPRDANQVRLHLEACWTCRARLEQINESITGVVEYSNFLIREKFPPSESGRTKFLDSLHRLVEAGSRPTLWNRITGMLNFFSGAAPRQAWITAVALVCMIALLVATFRPVTIVSADEIVRKSAESEKAMVSHVPRPVIYQKFRIEESGPADSGASGGDPSVMRSVERSVVQSVVRSIYSDPIGHRLVEGLDNGEKSDGQAAGRLKDSFAEAQLDWGNPLSLDSYEAWESHHRERAVQVERDDLGLISIRSTVPSGPVSELLLTFRDSDFHPVAEDIFLRNSKRIRVTEAFFEVFSMNVIEPGVFALSGNAELTPKAKPAPPVANPVRTPSEGELLEAEMRVRMALHSVKADLGDQIEIGRGESNSILVQGVLSSDTRKEEVESELQGIRDVQTSLTVPSEPSDSLMSAGAGTVAPDAVLLVEDQPLLQATLKAKFPELEARKSYVDSTLEAARVAMAHAWAVRHLRERYSPEEISELEPSARQMLELLIRDHVTAIRGEVEVESELLKQVLPRLPVSAGDGAVSCSGDEWQSSTQGAFECLEKIQDDTSILLAGSQNSQDANELVREVEETLQVLKKQLPCISSQVSGNFLAETKSN
jgi:hypothetical protein